MYTEKVSMLTRSNSTNYLNFGLNLALQKYFYSVCWCFEQPPLVMYQVTYTRVSVMFSRAPGPECKKDYL